MSQTKVANGNVSPSRATKLDTTGGALGRVLQAGAGDQCFGISQPGTRNTPLAGLDDGLAAIAGEELVVYVDGDKDVPWEAGGTITQGDRLKSDANGKAVATTNANDEIMALAKTNSTSGKIVLVDVLAPQKL